LGKYTPKAAHLFLWTDQHATPPF